jgi:ATP-dependent protease ClpP protease subunit
MWKIILILVGLFATSTAYPYAHMYGDINNRSVVPVIYKLSVDKDPVLFINSDGGDVEAGMLIINKIRELQARGISVTCLVRGQAKSMAFFIWTTCEDRGVLADAKLMFHDPYFILPEGAYKLRTLKQFVTELERDVKRLGNPTQLTLGVSEEEYRKHAEAETKWTPHALKVWAPNFNFIILEDKQ